MKLIRLQRVHVIFQYAYNIEFNGFEDVGGLYDTYDYVLMSDTLWSPVYNRMTAWERAPSYVDLLRCT